MSKPTTKTTSGRITTRAEEVHTKKKYPTFERVTAGRLAVGMKVLIRDGAQDHMLINGSTHPNSLFLPAGIYAVAEIHSRLEGGRARASRYYWLDVTDEQGNLFRVNAVSSVQRWNRVVDNG